jgi:hypothetical protein
MLNHIGKTLCSLGVAAVLNIVGVNILERHDAPIWIAFIVGGCAALFWNQVDDYLDRQ